MRWMERSSMEKELVFEILEELIKIDTANPPGNEKAAAEYLYRLFSKYGIEAELWDLGNHRANLTVSCGGEEPELMFCGHLDTVPVTEGWSVPPFRALRRDGRIYGRGTADMKGGIAAMSAAMIELSKERARFRGNLSLVFVADEEACNIGMRQFLKGKVNAGFAVIGEPTELKVATAHRGVLRDEIDIIDLPYHAALCGRESNAVNRAAKAVLSLLGMNETLQTYRHEVLPPPGIAVTKVEGYENDNIVPGVVRLLTDFRILPGMSFEECRRLEEQALEAAGKYEIREHFFLPGGETDSSHPFVRRCCAIGEKLLHREQKPEAFGASCEQCFLTAKGIPTVICGPGSLKQAHIIDEFVEEEQIRLAERYYIRIAKEFLTEDGTDAQ